jgi:hypothetical protein
MKRLPSEIRNKIVQLNKSQLRTNGIMHELDILLNKYMVDFSYLTNTMSDCTLKGEGFAFILNGECTTDESLQDVIDDIEQAFLKIVNEEG